MTSDQATKTVAAYAAAQVLRSNADRELVLWEDYPEIGEYDWEEVERQVIAVSYDLSPSRADYEAAYKFLADRAGGEE